MQSGGDPKNSSFSFVYSDGNHYGKIFKATGIVSIEPEK